MPDAVPLAFRKDRGRKGGGAGGRRGGGNFRRISFLAVGAALFLLGVGLVLAAEGTDGAEGIPEEPPLPEEPQEVPIPQFGGNELKGNFFYFQRARDRYSVERGEFRTNLHHSTLQSNIEFSSGYLAKSVGLDVAVFGSTDLENSGGPDHEISFYPWRDPWSANWSQTDARSGVSLYRAHLKFKREFGQIFGQDSGQNSGRNDAWAKIGYFQPSGPGVLGVNWSLMPGTYLGAEAGTNFGPLALAGAYVTKYKAPWYQHAYSFRQTDGVTRVDYLWSLGARYEFVPGFSLEAAYGESQNYLQNAHMKMKYERKLSENEVLYLTYQLYAMGDSSDGTSVNNLFDGTAFQHYVAVSYRPAPWSLRAEALHTRAPTNRPENAGYFAYRLIGAYGGSNGAYEPWWDNRSDWNHNRESAVFLRVGRTLDDIVAMPGWSLGASAVRGWGGRVYGVNQTLRETSYSFDVGYLVPSGPLKQTSINLHYTHYNNKTDLPSWTGFKNLFQDERDVKFFITVPWSL